MDIIDTLYNIANVAYIKYRHSSELLLCIKYIYNKCIMQFIRIRLNHQKGEFRSNYRNMCSFDPCN